MKRHAHLVMASSGELYCKNCDTVESVHIEGLSVDFALGILDLFVELHKDCTNENRDTPKMLQ